MSFDPALFPIWQGIYQTPKTTGDNIADRLAVVQVSMGTGGNGQMAMSCLDP